MAALTVGDFLQRLTTRGMAAELLGAESDRQLVERVLATRDESALLAIVLRHGAMVCRVCRRTLRHPQDAEDAFQATFLVLTQQLRALRHHSSLAGWLHGVALRVSRKAGACAMARQRRDAGAARAEAVPPDDLTWGEVRSALDEELSRLPDRWRLPLVLCYLEGRTQDEAADQLGWSKGTLRRRLGQAREALGRRLTGRGIAWPAAMLALAADGPTATALSAARVDSVVATALAVVGGKSPALAASATAAALAEGVLTPMFAKKIGVVAGALLVLTLVTAVGGQFYAAHAAQPNAHPRRGSVGLVGPGGDTAPTDTPGKDEPKKETGPGNEPITLTDAQEVWSVCFSPDGKRIATGTGAFTPGKLNSQVPGEVKVWDAQKGTEILTLKGHTDRVTCVCYSSDGKRIASAGADQTVRVWDAVKGEEIFVHQRQTRGTGSVCFSPDGNRIAGIGPEGLEVWDAESGKELLTLKAKGRPNGSVCFSPDGKRLASIYPMSLGGRTVPGEIKVWDAEKGTELLSLKGHTDFVASVCFSPDGKRLASAGADQIRVWDAENGQELLAVQGHTRGVNSLCFSPDGKRIASASADKTVKVWDAEKGTELLTLEGHTGLLRGVCFSPDGKRIASASKDQTVKVWPLSK